MTTTMRDTLPFPERSPYREHPDAEGYIMLSRCVFCGDDIGLPHETWERYCHRFTCDGPSGPYNYWMHQVRLWGKVDPFTVASWTNTKRQHPVETVWYIHEMIDFYATDVPDEFDAWATDNSGRPQFATTMRLPYVKTAFSLVPWMNDWEWQRLAG